MPRERIATEGLAYSELRKLTSLASRTTEQLRWSTNIVKSIETQWVVGNADVALQSFLDINQRAVQIDRTERYMIENRHAPTVITSRAIVNSARGHPYWGKFDERHVASIEKNAKLIYNAIFEPENAQPHRDTELQPAGPAHTANGQRIALDLVNITNSVKLKEDNSAEDQDGNLTARCIGTKPLAR